MAFMNARLNRSQMSDHLTGLPNRRGSTSTSWMRSKGLHETDRLFLSSCWMSTISSSTTIAMGTNAGMNVYGWSRRYFLLICIAQETWLAGMEESSLPWVLPNTEAKAAWIVAERLRLAILKQGTIHPDAPLGCVTISLVIASVTCTENISIR